MSGFYLLAVVLLVLGGVVAREVRWLRKEIERHRHVVKVEAEFLRRNFHNDAKDIRTAIRQLSR